MLNFSFCSHKPHICSLERLTFAKNATHIGSKIFVSHTRIMVYKGFFKIPSTRNPYFFTEIQYSKPF